MNSEENPREARIADLEARLAEVEETLRAIRQGEVDALVVAGADGDQVFTIQSAETPYRFLVEAMNEGALLIQNDGTILYANQHFADLAGVPLDEVIGGSFLAFFAPSNQPVLAAYLQQLRLCKEELALTQPNGSSRTVQISLAPLKREALEGFSVAVTDLTDRKAVEERLRIANARLGELVGELEHFSYTISHDMRAPLRAMKSFAAILQEDCAMCSRQENRELLERIGTAASRMDKLISSSLDYARILAQNLRTEPVDLSALIKGLIQTYPNLLPEKADIALAPNLPVVRGSEAALTQCFSNLLGNAVKFALPGRRPRVRVWGEPAGALMRIWIEDNGIGIAQDEQSRVFDMFFRGARDGYEGTGMGLALARKVVTRLGGRIGVESQEGVGSRFWVELPPA